MKLFFMVSAVSAAAAKKCDAVTLGTAKIKEGVLDTEYTASNMTNMIECIGDSALTDQLELIKCHKGGRSNGQFKQKRDDVTGNTDIVKMHDGRHPCMNCKAKTVGNSSVLATKHEANKKEAGKENDPSFPEDGPLLANITCASGYKLKASAPTQWVCHKGVWKLGTKDAPKAHPLVDNCVPTGKPTTGKPTTGKPTTGKPTTGKPTTGKPTTGKPTTGKNNQSDALLLGAAAALAALV